MRPGACAALTVCLTGMAALTAPAGQASPAASAKPARAAKAAEYEPPNVSAAERRAVRGAPVDDPEGNESPELRELRRFEENAFPRSGPSLFRGAQPDDAALPLPPGLTGRWGGTGDIPRELRSPEPSRGDERGAGNRPDWLRDVDLPDLPVRWEPQVLRYLEFFKNDARGRAIMTSWLRKMERFRPLIERVLDRHQLPRDIIYLAMIESGFEPVATSNKSAGGVWQFMPGVARAYGLEVSYWVDGRRDPEQATEAAARFLKDLYVRFGSWHLAFAGYNAGYGGMLRSIARYNTNDFWELCRHEAGLPWETSLYVPKILAAAIVGHNRRAFGYADVPADPPWAYDRIEVPGGTAFDTLARAAGTRPEVIEALNPELIRGRTPPDRGSVAVRIPLGTADLYAQAVAALRAASGERLAVVVLRFGETLDEVAKARGLSVRELRRLNAVSDASELRGGTSILVPVRSAPPASSDDEEDDAILVAVPDRVFGVEGKEPVFYRTRDGDTLEEIAGVFHVDPGDLVAWNNIDPEAKLQPKLVLRIFVPAEFDRADVMLLDPDKVRVVTLGSEEFLALEAARRGKTRLHYTARAGDTLAKIARRYGLSPGDLARINRLSAANELGEGQKVVVYSPTPRLPREITSSPRGKAAGEAALARNAPARRGPAKSSDKPGAKNTALFAPSRGAPAKPTLKNSAPAKVAPKNTAPARPTGGPTKPAPKKTAPAKTATTARAPGSAPANAPAAARPAARQPAPANAPAAARPAARQPAPANAPAAARPAARQPAPAAARPAARQPAPANAPAVAKSTPARR